MLALQFLLFFDKNFTLFKIEHIDFGEKKMG